jgi:hypothetical protein
MDCEPGAFLAPDLRLNQKDLFDILYFTPALAVIANLDDGSRSVAPEIVYTGVTDLELRFRLFFLSGDRLTDFGEKQNDRRPRVARAVLLLRRCGLAGELVGTCDMRSLYEGIVPRRGI